MICLLVLASPNFRVSFYKLLCDLTAQPRSVLFLDFHVREWEVEIVYSSDFDVVLQYLLIILVVFLSAPSCPSLTPCSLRILTTTVLG